MSSRCYSTLVPVFQKSSSIHISTPGNRSWITMNSHKVASNGAYPRSRWIIIYCRNLMKQRNLYIPVGTARSNKLLSVSLSPNGRTAVHLALAGYMIQDTVYFIISFLRNLNLVYNASLVIIKHNIKQRSITHQIDNMFKIALHCIT